MSFINATLTKRLNSLSVVTMAGIPVVPTFDNNKSPFWGWHLSESFWCSSLDIYFVFEKSITPELISFTEIKGIPESVYLGVE